MKVNISKTMSYILAILMCLSTVSGFFPFISLMAGEEQDLKIIVTPDMLFFEASADEVCTPDKLFDGNPGQGANWETNSWNAYGQGWMRIDLGGHYRISRMDLYNIGWDNHWFEVSVGETRDELRDIWKYEGDVGSETILTFDTGRDCKAIRYIYIETNGGYFGELELYGIPVQRPRGLPAPQIIIKPEMISYNLGEDEFSTAEQAFDLERRGSYWNGSLGCAIKSEWSTYDSKSVRYIEIDLGDEYNLYKMDVYTIGWVNANSDLITKVGATKETMTELWKLNGGEYDSDICMTKDISEKSVGVRYISIEQTGGGVYREIEFYGHKTSEDPHDTLDPPYDPYAPEIEKILVESNMIIYEREETHKNSPEALFDGIIQGASLGWVVSDSVSNFVIDLGKYYAIETMDLFTSSQTDHIIRVSAGVEEDEMIDLWSYEGQKKEESVSFDVSEDCKIVRFVYIEADGGVYKELEFYGYEVPAPPPFPEDPLVLITPDMLIYDHVDGNQDICTPDKLFDGNPGQGAFSETNAWCSQKDNMSILVDLGSSYNISKMLLYSSSHNTHKASITVRAGRTMEDLVFLWSGGDSGEDDVKRYKVLGDCDKVRYLSIEANAEGYFGELEIYGIESSGAPMDSQIIITEEMLAYDTGMHDSNLLPAKLFDGKSGWGEEGKQDAWHPLGNTSFLIDLGDAYNIKRMNLSSIGDTDETITLSAGETIDEFIELWTFDGSTTWKDALTSYHPGDNCIGIRYIKIDVSGEGYFGELEFWGMKTAIANADPLIKVTKDMISYSGSGGSRPPENMFDGKISPVDGGADDWDLYCWNSWGAVSYFVVDLGDYYNISKMVLYAYAWQKDDYPLTVSAGAIEDDLMELWVHRGGGIDTGNGIVATYDTSKDCIGVRYIAVRAGSNGYFKELELYGRPASAGGGLESIQISQDMIVSGADESFMKLFDGERESKWNAESPTEVLIDLGGLYNIAKVNLYRVAFVYGSFKVEGGKSIDNMGVIAQSEDPVYFNNWVQMDTSALIRYIKITASKGYWGELQLIGSSLDGDYTIGSITNLGANEIAEAGPSIIELIWNTQSIIGLDDVSPDGFEVRYSESEITDKTWDEASIANDPPIPSLPKGKNRMYLYGLKEGTKYYFAVKGIDYRKDGNYYSEISNIATVTTRIDNIPPGDIGDFAALAGSNSVKFIWTATGNDGGLGIAASYKLLYSKDSISDQFVRDYMDGNIDLTGNIFSVPNMIQPSKSGIQEEYKLRELTPDTIYNFVLIVIDEKGQFSFVRDTVKTKIQSGAPAAVTDLEAIIDEAGDQIILNFTGNTGIEFYDIRYSSESISEENFKDAKIPEYVLDIQGTQVTAKIIGIYNEGEYYFALKSADYDDRVSPVSNLAKVHKAGFIPVEEGMLIWEHDIGNPFYLFDEHPVSIQSFQDGEFIMEGTPVTQWQPGGPLGEEPVAVIVNLMGDYHISQIYFYDVAGSSTMNIYTGTPFAWTKSGTSDMGKTDAWNNIDLDTTTKYIRFEFLNKSQVPKEISIYGKLTGKKDTIPQLTPRGPVNMDSLIGTNAFIDDFTDILYGFGNIREYHNRSWTDKDGESYFNPSVNGAWDFDAYYKKLHEAGIYVIPTIMDGDKELDQGFSPTDPLGYKAYASHTFQYAARYGNQIIADSLLKVATGQSRRSGLGYISGLEILNEQNGGWLGRNAYYTPFENAAFMSANYDGHEGGMGAGYGIKNADPDLEVSIGGLVGIPIERFKAMLFWSQFNRRDGKLPMDIFNVHHYSTSQGTGLSSSRSVGISTEDGTLLPQLRELAEYRDRYAPHIKICLSEFGWDTNPESPGAALANDNYTAWQVQGQWLLRTYLLCSALGIDSLQQYMIRDTGPEESSPGVYSTSGLVTLPDPQNGRPFEEKKDSWYYIFTLKNRLAGYRFAEQIPSGREDVLIYRYENNQGDNAYALWCPTSGGFTFVNNYEFELVGNADKATQVEFMYGTTQGTSSDLNVLNGKTKVNISETPILVFEGKVEDNLGPTWIEGAQVNMLERKVSGSTVTVKLSLPEALDDHGVGYYTFYDAENNIIIPKNAKSRVAGSVEPLILASNRLDGVEISFSTNQDYTINIYAANYKGVEGKPITITILADGTVLDEEAPSPPENLRKIEIGQTSISFEWDKAKEGIAPIKGYRVYRDGVLVADIEALSFIVTGLIPDTEYSFAVTAYDEAGKESPKSAPINLRTDPSGDPKIAITPDMLIYNREEGHTMTPEELFDGIRGGPNLGWATWSSVSRFLIDLGEYYEINRMDLYTMSWTNHNQIISISAGSHEDNLVDLWSYAGTEKDEVVSFDVSGECEMVRFIYINAVGGAYRELEVYGRQIGGGLSEPTNLRIGDIGNCEVTLEWDPPAEGIATGYKVYMDDEEVAEVNDIFATITGLEPDTEYTFAISAYDGAGNESGQSQPLIVRTESLEEKKIIEGLKISGIPDIVEAGEEIEVTITAKQVANLAGIDLKLGYNEELFELKEIILNENFDLDLEDFNYEVKDGVIRLINLILCDGSGYTGDIDIIKLVMKAKDKDALTSISILEGTKLSDIDADLYVVEESIEEVLAIANSDITGGGTAINDLVLIAKAFGLSQGDVGYDPRLDMNKDGIIDIVDIAYVSNRVLKKLG